MGQKRPTFEKKRPTFGKSTALGLRGGGFDEREKKSLLSAHSVMGIVCGIAHGCPRPKFSRRLPGVLFEGSIKR